MKITADKEYLKKVVDKADYARLYYVNARKNGEEAPAAKEDWHTASHYFTYLGVKALEDEEFCEELEETLKELVEGGVMDTSLKPQLSLLCQFIQIGRWVRYDPEDNPGVEELEKDFDAFFDRVSIERASEKKKDLAEFIRSQSDEENSVNQMYG